jgi:hypothetical protein
MNPRPIHLALVISLMMVATSAAVAPLPARSGAARMPEPGPAAAPMPPLVPGPIPPGVAPAGAPDELNLPIDHSAAFQAETFPDSFSRYLHFGGTVGQGLRLGIGNIARLGPLQFDSGGECYVLLLYTRMSHQLLRTSPRLGFVHELHLLERLHCSLELEGLSMKPHVGISWLPWDRLELSLGFDLMRWQWNWDCNLLF